VTQPSLLIEILSNVFAFHESKTDEYFGYRTSWLEYNTVVAGRMVRGECAWVVFVSISYTGDGGQLGSSFLWSRQGG